MGQGGLVLFLGETSVFLFIGPDPLSSYMSKGSWVLGPVRCEVPLGGDRGESEREGLYPSLNGGASP